MTRSAPIKRPQGELDLDWPCEYWRLRMELGYGSFTAWCHTTSCQFPRIRGYDCGNCQNAKSVASDMVTEPD